MIERQTYIDRLNSWKDKQIIKVLTGIRRCGKSTLLGMFASKLRDESAANNIISLNMEDLDNERLQNYREFYTYVKELLTDGRNYLFVDEIQMIPEFQRAIDSLQLIDNLDIYITGSNAYLLSGELSTLLSGRYVEIKIFPLSFKEFASAMPASMTREEIYSNYITFGSLPYVTRLMPNRELVRDYLEGVYNTIVVKDVVARRNISDVMMLEKIMSFLADNIGNISSAKKIGDILTAEGRKISSPTVENYTSALCDSFICYQAARYDLKEKDFLRTGRKYYLADMGMRNKIIGTRTGDLGHILENVVFLELLRRGGEVYVGKLDKEEIDFVVVRHGKKEYYQVALTVRDSATLERELRPLRKITDAYPRYLLTLDPDPEIDHAGIRQIYALSWLSE